MRDAQQAAAVNDQDLNHDDKLKEPFKGVRKVITHLNETDAQQRPSQSELSILSGDKHAEEFANKLLGQLKLFSHQLTAWKFYMQAIQVAKLIERYNTMRSKLNSDQSHKGTIQHTLLFNQGHNF